MSIILAAIAANMAPVIGSAVAALVGLGIHLVLKRVAAKIDDQTLTSVLDKMGVFAGQAVNSIEQTMVDKMIKEGTWGSAGSYKQALDAGVAAMKTLAAAQLPQLAASGVTDINAFLTHMIESKIKDIQLAKETPAASIIVPMPAVAPAAQPAP